jgi:anti-sigma-K factor RskA
MSMAAPSPVEEPEAAPPLQEQANWPWIPWLIAGAFAVICFVLLAMTGKMRQRSNDLHQQLADAQAAYSDLQNEHATLQNKLARTETNYSARVSELQKQVVQKSQEMQKQKAELETKLENRANEAADAQKQLKVMRTQAAQNAAALERLGQQPLTGENSPNQNQNPQLRVGIMHPTTEFVGNVSASAAWDIAGQKGVLVVEGLAPLSGDRDYQLWILDATVSTPISGGVFNTNERGGTRTEFSAASPVQSADRYAISVERKGGSTVPGRYILVSN